MATWSQKYSAEIRDTTTGKPGLFKRPGFFPLINRLPPLALQQVRELSCERDTIGLIAIKEEAAPELEAHAKRLHWVSLGELSKTIELLQKEGVQVELAPRPESRPHPLWERFAAVMREAASYLAWKAGLP